MVGAKGYIMPPTSVGSYHPDHSDLPPLPPRPFFPPFFGMSYRVTQQEHKAFQDKVRGYVEELENETNPQLQERYRKKLETFLKSLHRSEWKYKEFVYTLINGHIEAEHASAALKALWSTYKADSEWLQQQLQTTPPPTAPVMTAAPRGFDPYNSMNAQAAYSGGSLSDPIVGARPYGPFGSFGHDQHWSTSSSPFQREIEAGRAPRSPHAGPSMPMQAQGGQGFGYPAPGSQYAAQSMPMQHAQPPYPGYAYPPVPMTAEQRAQVQAQWEAQQSPYGSV
ncbi:hypothetical protein C8R46DRAFT_1130375 [Mycena filopes]|nr:hypothetical protein C8R46DRAFT_1130375 [Mycena filopes]